MKHEDKLIRELSLRFGIDTRVVKEVVYHPLKFAKHKIEDDHDFRPIRIRYFGVFIQKEKVNKQMRNWVHILWGNLEDVSYVMHAILDYEDIISEEDTKTRITDLYADNDIDEIRRIYNAYMEYVK